MSRHYDAVIVGGGVVGALVAKILSEAGKNVLILEAGIKNAMDPSTYQQYLKSFYTEGGVRGMPNGPYPWNASAPSPAIPSMPVGTSPYYQYGTQMHFMSDYLRMLGGTTLHWQGTSLRLVPNDFKMKSVYNKGFDWPITYDDLEPAYRRAEYELGVSADVEDQLQLKFAGWYPEGYVYPMHKMPPSQVDIFFKEALHKRTVKLQGKTYPLTVVGIPVARNSTPNKKYNFGDGYQPSSAIADRDKGLRCQGNSSCLPICPVQAKYSALRTINDLVKKGRVEVQTQSVASRLVIDKDSGKISELEYKRYDEPGSANYKLETVKGTLIVLAANAIENATLLLASGAARTSKQVGKNLMDHPYLYAWGYSSQRVYPFRGPDTTSGMESLRDGDFRKFHASFRASLSNWGWSGEPGTQIASLLSQRVYGKDLRNTLADRMTRMVKIGFMFEQLPTEQNYVTIDPNYKDALGNFKPVFSYHYDDYTLKGIEEAIYNVWPTITEYAGIENHTSYPPGPTGANQSVPFNGRNYNIMGSGHIVGTHKMGNKKSDSVTDTNMKAWDHSNLYIVGAGSQVTIGTANPTLTAAALSVRAAEAMLKDLL
ncbi:MAG TPA: GMC family oxidoreductase [Chitinophagaceae bacterium]|nr:GMC family oxidoreductase [Chitinophagaceae bacterium]